MDGNVADVGLFVYDGQTEIYPAEIKEITVIIVEKTAKVSCINKQPNGGHGVTALPFRAYPCIPWLKNLKNRTKRDHGGLNV